MARIDRDACPLRSVIAADTVSRAVIDQDTLSQELVLEFTKCNFTIQCVIYECHKGQSRADGHLCPVFAHVLRSLCVGRIILD